MHFDIDLGRDLHILATMNIKCIVACINANGESDLFFVKVSCNLEEYKNGEHYFQAEEKAEKEGYEKPMVSFSENDAAGRAMIKSNLFVWESASTIDIHGNEIKK